MYDSKTRVLIENPLNRYLVNSSMFPQLKKNADGGITLCLQHKSPGPERCMESSPDQHIWPSLQPSREGCQGLGIAIHPFVCKTTIAGS